MPEVEIQTIDTAARSLDRYSKPRATRKAIVRAHPGPSPVPAVPSPDDAEPKKRDVPRE